MESKRFIKKVENFTCEQCGFSVVGNGFTNHCPRCLFSKHVDINPGDRAEKCQGLMRPSGVLQDSGWWVIVHVCERCGAERRKRSVPEDNFETLLTVAKSVNE